MDQITKSSEKPIQFLTDNSGERTAVLLSIAHYEELMEDLEDLAAIADRRSEPTIGHDEFVKKLKEDGILPS